MEIDNNGDTDEIKEKIINNKIQDMFEESLRTKSTYLNLKDINIPKRHFFKYEDLFDSCFSITNAEFSGEFYSLYIFPENASFIEEFFGFIAHKKIVIENISIGKYNHKYNTDLGDGEIFKGLEYYVSTNALKSFSMQHCIFNDKAIHNLCKALFGPKLKSYYKPIASIHFDYGDFSKCTGNPFEIFEIFKIIALHRKVKNISTSNIKTKESYSRSMLNDILINNVFNDIGCLNSLSFPFWDLDDDNIINITNKIRKKGCYNITSINLNNNKITSIGAIALFDRLSNKNSTGDESKDGLYTKDDGQCVSLNQILFGFNKLDSSCMGSLVELLKIQKNRVVLDLSHNKNIDDKGIATFASLIGARYKRVITELNLVGCSVTEVSKGVLNAVNGFNNPPDVYFPVDFNKI